jgi:hypothetical protein
MADSDFERAAPGIRTRLEGRSVVTTRVYLASARLVGRALSAAKALHDGLWLGMLDQAALDQIDAAYYERHRMYVDDDHNTRGLWVWERRAIETYFSDRRRLIVTGAGGGREVVALADLGHEVTGYECNSQLLEAARDLLARRRIVARVHPMPRGQWPSTAPTADGVVIGWGSYMLIRGRERRIAVLKGARSVLATGAPVLVSFFVRPDDHSPYYRTIRLVADTLGRCRHNGSIELGDALAPNFVHVFTMREIREELAAAGFSLASSGNDHYGWAVGIAVDEVQDITRGG